MQVQLGVNDIAYSAAATRPVGSRSQGAKAAAKTVTTFQVAEMLEANYGVMRVFAELHGREIADAIAKAELRKAELRAAGHPTHKRKQPLAEVEDAFRNYLDSREYERTSGLAINAAVAGVSHRFLHPFSMYVNPKLSGKKQALHQKAMLRKERPAFVDTGLYEASFRAMLT